MCGIEISQQSLKILAKKNAHEAFLDPFLAIFGFSQKSQLGKLEGSDFKYDNSVFKLLPKNIKTRHFESQIKTFLFIQEILQLDKFECAHLKYHNSFSKF